MKANWMDPSFLPKRKRAITRQLADELLVYETKTKRAHCLDATAGEIWRMCDGTKTAAQIAQAMRKEQQLLIDENSIRLTLARFAKAGLLQSSKRVQHRCAAAISTSWDGGDHVGLAFGNLCFHSKSRTGGLLFHLGAAV
jgi:hypothetical protein